ncbi:MAG: hypothetical protein KC656_09090 [Myxococcales bacterium]|nr:hypothetical protein [Myxococcales bacterium]MCB9673098.1 hypothetical protein [Alphaproteobacteria bacterium]MCB9694955.1 hypothetical protein [Alphaproteobacteria bacterium]
MSDDDMQKVKGRKGNLVGRIRERYGDAKEAAAERLDAFLGSIREQLA